MKPDQCCNQDCRQGRDCPNRKERRQSPSLMRRLLGWALKERRSGFDRRQRVDLNVVKLTERSIYGIPMEQSKAKEDA